MCTLKIYIRDGNRCARTNVFRFVWHTIQHSEHLAIFTFWWMKRSAAVGPHKRKQVAFTEPTETEQSQMLYVDFDVYMLRARLVYVLIPSALALLCVPDWVLALGRASASHVLLSPPLRLAGVYFPPFKSHRRVYYRTYKITDFIKYGGGKKNFPRFLQM